MELLILIILWFVAGFVGMMLQWFANQMVRRATSGGYTPFEIFPQSMILGGLITLFFGVHRFMMARSDPYSLLDMRYVDNWSRKYGEEEK